MHSHNGSEALPACVCGIHRKINHDMLTGAFGGSVLSKNAALKMFACRDASQPVIKTAFINHDVDVFLWRLISSAVSPPTLVLMETANLNTDTSDMRRKGPGWNSQAFPWFLASNVSTEVSELRPFSRGASISTRVVLAGTFRVDISMTGDPKLIAFIIHWSDTSRSAACEIVSLTGKATRS